MAKDLIFLWLAAMCAVGLSEGVAEARGSHAGNPLGLYVSKSGVLMHDGKPFRGVGVNYFEAFADALAKPGDTGYKQAFQTLARYKIPFVRFMACGFWPTDNALYLKDKQRYFELMDGVVKAAEANHVGLIPSLFWNPCTVPDMVGEPMDQYGNPDSKTIEYIRSYTREMVTRYKNSSAIWGWEFGNERNLEVDFPNPSDRRPPVAENLGTPKLRTKRDELTSEMTYVAFVEFAKEIRKYDKSRMIMTGNTLPRSSAWHMRTEHTWKQDTREQFAETLAADSPDPVNVISGHLYSGDGGRFGGSFSAEEVLNASMAVAAKIKKPLFVGEFGSNEEKGHEAAREDFSDLLAAIEKTGVPAAALWAYVWARQDAGYGVTDTNNRAYQLDAIAEVNQRLQR